MSRRHFLATTAAAAFTIVRRHVLGGPGYQAPSATLNIAGIGVGGMDRDNVRSCAGAGENIYALCDVDKEYAARTFKVYPKAKKYNDYRKMLEKEKSIDAVILAMPLHFRPEHLKAAVEAGKHVFMEKPVAVDAGGVRSVIATSELAAKKNLSIVAGTQRRHQNHYQEVMKRIHNGDIGEIVAAQCYWIDDYDYYKAVLRQPGWSDMEWQCRNWNYFTWLSGDHIVE